MDQLTFLFKGNRFSTATKKKSLYLFLAKYLFSVFCYAIEWWLFPTLALAVFIGMAAFHFGELYWPLRDNTKLVPIVYSTNGFLCS
jgi:hypothetical protein